MSPWRMMEEWGIPTFYLQAMTNELCGKLAAKGAYIPDIAIGGGFSTEDHIFKAFAMGAPYTKAVCMGRALMISGMVGKNIGLGIEANDLPKTISKFGDTIEKIFVCYEEVKEKVGLQQIMAGARKTIG